MYPLGFGDSVKDAMESWSPTPTLRQKRAIDTSKTDLEIFSELPMGDVWPDAELVSCYRYMRNNKKIVVPGNWETVLKQFDRELGLTV